ncbi:MurR/RpiR family transcriptional regulator [Actinosynnema sp. NPDC020468]|uniref:MurR/RpiR family transcriptional regulator n=1 Tax=Actinosynnema sp. NPDC020468 TaxID=3154488 RepID=UPI0033F4611F
MVDSPSNADTLEQIRSLLPSLSPAERRVGQVVLGAPLDVLEQSVTQLAERSKSSVGSVVRFCQSLGLRGFQDLKLRLARQSIPAERQLLDEIAPEDGAAEVTRKVFSGMAGALTDTARVVDTDVLDEVAARLVGARRVLFVAVGTSAPLAADVAYRLTTIGLPATCPADVHVQHVTARMLGPEDVCFAISHTGSTTETLAAVRTAAQTGATTVALTSFTTSPLTGLVDLALVAGSRETSYRIETMTSRIVHLAVLDAIFVLIALRHQAARDALAATGDVLTEHRI